MRSPIGYLFGRVAGSRANAFVVLFTLDAAYRALLITIVPQRAYALLGSATKVTLLYLAASVAGLAVNLSVPILLHRFSRSTILTAAVSTAVLTCALFATETIPTLVIAIILQVSIGATLEVLINLYMLENVARRDLNRFEPLRLLFGGSTFVLCPWLGVVLDSRIAPNLTFAVAALLSIALLISFRRLILGNPDHAQQAPNPGESPPASSPLTLVPRFARQPRLVLAWVLAIGRNGWWYMYLVYTPILVANYGYGAETGGAIVSLGMLPMFVVRLWAALGARFGIRALLVCSYAVTGIMTILVGLSAGHPKLSLLLLVLAACCATSIDGAGNVPFLRAVRPLERAQMTSVYMTFRHVASLVIPATFTVVLLFAPLSAVFLASGTIGLGMAALSRYLPRRL